MAKTRVMAAVLWALPVLAILILFTWAFADLLRIPPATIVEVTGGVLLSAFAVNVLGFRFGRAYLRRVGLGLLVLIYFGAHLIFLPLDATAALGFLTLALFAVELRIVADRFVPLYAGLLEGEDRERVGTALLRSLIRVVAVSGVAFLASSLAADLALAGTLPVTTIPTALVLAAALIGVILILALWPVLERREAV
jgi:hypothetical protein